MATNMTFVDYQTIVPADWLNNVNFVVNNLPATIIQETSIANLRLVASTSFQAAWVKGYYTTADGGGGFYVLDPTDLSSADNGGTIIVGNDGGRWKLQYSGAVSVKQFGAKGDGVHDDAPPIQACVTAVTDTWIPAGNYLMNSTNAAPIPVTDPINILIQSKNNFSIRCSSNAQFLLSATANLSCVWGFWKCNNFVFDGANLVGNRTGLVLGQESVGINLMSVTNFQIRNVRLSGSWIDSGTAFGGDWMVNGLIENVQADSIGQGFDIAFMQNVTFRNINMFGQSAGGTCGQIGFNTSYDVPLATYNSTGISFLGNNTNHIYFENCKFANFNAGAFITTGSYFYFDEHCNFNNCAGTSSGSIQGWGMIITWINSYPAQSAGFPCNKFYFQGTHFENNGLLIGGGGCQISGSGITNGDIISDIYFDNCHFYNNGPTGLVTTGETHLSKIVSTDGTFISGGSQANAIAGLIINGMNASGLPNNARLINNFGFNPYGYFTPALPGGTGAANKVTNTYAFPCTVHIFTNAAAYQPVIVELDGVTTANLGTVAANSGPLVLDLQPGTSIYFNTAVPVSWTWLGK